MVSNINMHPYGAGELKRAATAMGVDTAGLVARSNFPAATVLVVQVARLLWPLVQAAVVPVAQLR